MPRFNDLGEVAFKGDEPDYVSDYGFRGKGNWLLVVVGPGEKDKAAFGPFPSDEDAVEFAHHFFVDAPHLTWGVSEMVNPRDLPAVGEVLHSLGVLQVSIFHRERPEGEES